MADVAEDAETVKQRADEKREHKQFDFAAQCKMLEEGDGGFEGILSPFGKLDDVDDIIVPGAYKNTIPDFLLNGWVAPDHTWGVKHDVGIYTDAKETQVGLYVVAEFHATPDAQSIRAKVKKRLDRGKSVKLSIGFVTVTSESMPGKEAAKYLIDPTPQERAYCESRMWVRVIFEVKLYEGSLVSVPAASQANVLSVKSSAMETEQKAKPGTVVIENKSVEQKDETVLGEWVEQSMTCRAIGAVMDALWYLIYDCVYPWPYDDAPPVADRLVTLRTGWAEGIELIASVITAILGDEAAETPEEAVETLAAWGVAALAERKGAKIERKDIGASPVGVPLQIHSERVLAAATGLKDRLSSLHQLRTKEGRTFSQANCDRIEEHCKALDTVVADLRGMLAGSTKDDTETASAETEAEKKSGENVTTNDAGTADGTGNGAGDGEVKAASPALQALIRSKYNALMESSNG